MQDSSSPKENQTKRLRQRIVVPNSFLEYNENDATSPGTTDAADVDIFKRRPGQSFLEWCAEHQVNYGIMRKLNRQPVRITDPGLVWDSFELPKEFEGEEIPPLPPTPVFDSRSPLYDLPPAKNNKPAIDKRRTLLFMKDLAQRMNENSEMRRRERDRLGLSSTEAAVVEEGDGGDSDSSFILDYSPSPIPKTERVKRANAAKLKVIDGATPTKRQKASDSTPPPELQVNVADLTTPRSRRPSRPNSSFNSSASADTESQLIRRTRLSFDEKVPCSEDEEVWPEDDDDEILSQMNLNFIEISSVGGLGSSQIQNEIMVHGEGFEDSDPSEDFLFSQLNY